MKLSTTRLAIRSFENEDVASYSKIVSEPEVVRFLGNGKPHSYEQAKDYVLDCIARDRSTGVSRYAVELSEQLIGFCGYKSMNGYTDFGWRYSRLHWGNGYGTEAAVAVLDFGINELALDDICVAVHADNVGSVRIAEKLRLPHKSESRLQEALVYKFSQRKVA